jgi:sugar/nucleoside kinase (ribokinase family)
VERCGAESEILFKWGARGALLHTPFGPVAAEAFRVEAIDTVAAGDAHSAAFAVACAENLPAEQALRFANAAGALACTRRGAFPAMPTRSEVDRLLGR